MPLLFGLGYHELLIILAIVLLIFGSTKLPALARSLGSSVTQFKRGLKDDDRDLLDEHRTEGDLARRAGERTPEKETSDR